LAFCGYCQNQFNDNTDLQRLSSAGTVVPIQNVISET
jgi:hypothetical protein